MLIILQDAQLSQKDRAMLRVIKYLARSLEVIATGTIRKFGYGFLFPSRST